MDLTFEQWLLFVAASFRARYVAVARNAFPELEARLPLTRRASLTVLQVNGGEAVHFLYTDTGVPGATSCRSIALEAPGGMPVRDWALLDEEGYKRFVERGIAGALLWHFVLYPHEGDEQAALTLAAEEAARAHALALRA